MNKKYVILLGLTALAIITGILIRRLMESPSFDPEIGVCAQEQDKATSLLEFFHTIGPQMERFPYRLIAFTDSYFYSKRFRGTLTFERYLLFHRYKNRVLNATRDEVNECVSVIETLSPKEKALVLVAIYLLDQTRHNDSMIHTDKEWRLCDRKGRVTNSAELMNYSRYYRDFVKNLRIQRTRNSTTFVEFYPYSFPFMVDLPVYMLGVPKNDSFISHEDWNRWGEVFESYRTCDDVAFPAIEYDDEFLSSRFENELNKILFFKDIFRKTEEKNKSNAIWNEWLTGCDDCVQRIESDLNLSITPEEWILGNDEKSKDFLRLVSRMENSLDVSVETAEKFRAMREYWLTFRTPDGFRSTAGFGAFPVIDIDDNDDITLGEIVRNLDCQ